MPTYEYKCTECGEEFEEFQWMSEPLLTECPKCHKETLYRKISGGGGLLFKGDGFYETDYRSKSYKKGQAGDTASSPVVPDVKPSTKKESK